MIKINFILTLLLLTLAVKSQECAYEITPSYRTQYQQLIQSRSLDLTQVQDTVTISPWIVLDSLGNPNKSEATIQSNVDDLNNLFSPIKLHFKICEFRYIENYNYDYFTRPGEDNEIYTLYREENTINIYYITVITDAPTVAGYAYGPVGKDMIVLTKGAGWKTLAHEMGHYYGLIHTHAGSGELVDGSNCATNGDGLCDTSADPGGDNDATCNYIDDPAQDANGDWYLPPSDNIMSYYSQFCRCRFTNEQYNLMAQVAINLRHYLW